MATLYIKNPILTTQVQSYFKSNMIIDILRMCFDLASILVRRINCGSVRDLSLLVGFEP
jgi:hypothetical protein